MRAHEVLQKLASLGSAFALLVSAATIVLWIHSYSTTDLVIIGYDKSYCEYSSVRGTLTRSVDRQKN